MEIKSDQFIEELVTDISIAFPSGIVKEITLRPGDFFEDLPTELRFSEHFFTGMVENTVVNKSHIAFYTTKVHTVRRPVSYPILSTPVEGGITGIMD